jgi:hypothetical protein
MPVTFYFFNAIHASPFLFTEYASHHNRNGQEFSKFKDVSSAKLFKEYLKLMVAGPS